MEINKGGIIGAVVGVVIGLGLLTIPSHGGKIIGFDANGHPIFNKPLKQGVGCPSSTIHDLGGDKNETSCK